MVHCDNLPHSMCVVTENVLEILKSKLFVGKTVATEIYFQN